MSSQNLELVGCETCHAKGDVDIEIVKTTEQSAISCEMSWWLMVYLYSCFCVFILNMILAKYSSNQRSGHEQ